MTAGIMTASVPSNWKMFRLGQLFEERKQKGSDVDFPPLSVTKQGIVPQLETAAKTDDSENRKIIRAGDFVINSRSDRKGSGGLSDRDGSTSQISIVLQPRNIFPRFAHHLLRSSAFQEEFYMWGHGIVADLWTTRFRDMKNIQIAIPNQTKQREIADFLDRETEVIDNVVSKRLQMIELFEERLACNIDRLTLGYSPKGPTAVGDEVFLGSPSHWQVKPLWAVSKVKKITGREEEQLLSVYLKRGVIPYSEGGGLVHKPSESLEKYQLVSPGDFVLNNQQAWRGSVGVSNYNGIVSPAYVVLSLSEELDRDFANSYFRSRHFTSQLAVSSGGVGDIQRPIKSHLLRQAKVLIPPRREANEIAAKIKVMQVSHDEIVSRLKLTLDAWTEYRAALITAAVKGQIDVNEYRRSGSVDRHLDTLQQEHQA